METNPKSHPYKLGQIDEGMLKQIDVACSVTPMWLQIVTFDLQLMVMASDVHVSHRIVDYSHARETGVLVGHIS